MWDVPVLDPYFSPELDFDNPRPPPGAGGAAAAAGAVAGAEAPIEPRVLSVLVSESFKKARQKNESKQEQVKQLNSISQHFEISKFHANSNEEERVETSRAEAEHYYILLYIINLLVEDDPGVLDRVTEKNQFFKSKKRRRSRSNELRPNYII